MQSTRIVYKPLANNKGWSIWRGDARLGTLAATATEIVFQPKGSAITLSELAGIAHFIQSVKHATA